MMTRTVRLMSLGLLLGAGGCALLEPAPSGEADAGQRLEYGLAALHAGAHMDAFDELTWVYLNCAGHVRGSQALSALAASELSPANPAARPAVGAELLVRSLRDPGLPDWARPLTEVGYLMALSLGAPEPDIAAGAAGEQPGGRDTAAAPAAAAQAEPEADTAAAAVAGAPRPPTRPGRARGCGPAVDADSSAVPPLPRLPGQTMAAMLRGVQAGRDSLALRNAALTTELATVRARLLETEQELERIRRTLRP